MTAVVVPTALYVVIGRGSSSDQWRFDTDWIDRDAALNHLRRLQAHEPTAQYEVHHISANVFYAILNTFGREE